MAEYIDIPIVADTDVLIQQALTSIVNNVPGWVPREGNLEVLLVEQFAQMAAEAATVASAVPSSIFEYFGSLIGITPSEGTYAEIQTTWTLVANAPTGGYVIPAGTVAGFFYEGNSYLFQTITNNTIVAGQTTGSFIMQAVGVGSTYNIQGLTGINPLTTYLQMQNSDPNVSGILITATAATNTALTSGTDPESTTNFLNRLTSELQLLAPRPITPSDYALFSQNLAGVYRALAFDGFNPLTNRLTTADANFLTAATSDSAPANWGTFGNGTVALPTLSTPGTSPANYLQFTSSSSAPLSGALLHDATLVEDTSVKVIVGTGSISTSVSSGNPALILINDATNGNEIVVVTAAASKSGSGGTATQILTVLSPGFKYAHDTSASVTLLQGAVVPNAVNLSANTNWYQAAAIIQAASATTATASPYIVSVATYVDGTTEVFSSREQFASGLYSYTTFAKTVYCNIFSTNTSSPNALAFDANIDNAYNQLKPYVVSIQSYIAFNTTETSKTHNIFYNSLNQVQADLSYAENPTTSVSNYNFIPDAKFINYLYTNGGNASWTTAAGLMTLPNYGVQYIGTGSAAGSTIQSDSQIFNLSNISSDLPSATTRTYTLAATIDASYTGATFADVNIVIVDASNPSTVLATLAPTGALLQTIVGTFTLSTPTDVQVLIQFKTGLNVPLGSSVIVSNVAVFSGSYTILTLPESNNFYYSWTPGGLYDPNTFNYPRNVTVVPVDSNGLAVSPTIAYGLIDYLDSRREVNFTVQSINPSYVPIDVQYSVYVSPTYASSTVQSSVDAAIRAYLSPATWGGGMNSPAYWDGSSTTIRVMDIAAVIGAVNGVYSVISVNMRTSYPVGGSYAGTDIALNGIAPLPIANTITGSVFTNSQNAYSGLG